MTTQSEELTPEQLKRLWEWCEEQRPCTCIILGNLGGNKMNKWCRGKTVIPHKLVFGGGFPKFHLIPHVMKWGNNISLFWLDTELVWLGG